MTRCFIVGVILADRLLWMRPSRCRAMVAVGEEVMDRASWGGVGGIGGERALVICLLVSLCFGGEASARIFLGAGSRLLYCFF